MTPQQALAALLQPRDLNEAEMEGVVLGMLNGTTTPVQMAGILVALRAKGESVGEITAAAKVLRELAEPVPVHREGLVDTCGTGGDASGTFNVSTAVAIVVAAAGGRVAKHGNRSVSSRSGSADVLEQAGVNLELSPAAVARCIDEIGVGFLYAPRFHQAMKYAAGPRKELGVRTLFNLLGPLSNPAHARCQLLGVYAAHWVQPLAEVLRALGTDRALVVSALDGLDEISIAAPTQVAELKDGEIRSYVLQPEDLGFERGSLDELRVADAAASLTLIRKVFDGQPGPARDIVAANAGAALYVGGLAPDIVTGVHLATQAIIDGRARERLAALVDLSRQLSQVV